MPEEAKPKVRNFREWIGNLVVSLFTGFASWDLIDEIVVNEHLGLPSAETSLAAMLAGAIVVFVLSSKWRGGGLWWASKNLFFIIGFYLAFWKVPILLRPWMSPGIGRGLALVVFFGAVYAALKISGLERRVNLTFWLIWSLFWTLFLLLLGSFTMGR